jgi:hypothetical protein
MPFLPHRLRLAAALSLASFVLSGAAFAQGSLTPPGGSPAPTMKRLDQIEPRTPVSSLPFTISESGSYYLTQDLTLTVTGHAITITASNVTLDLNGFTVASAPAVGPGSFAIHLPGGQSHVVIRNGRIVGLTKVSWTGSHPTRSFQVVPAGFDTGIFAGSDTRNIQLHDLTVFGCRKRGAFLQGQSHIVHNCHFEQNGEDGLFMAFGAVSHSTAMVNGVAGFDVTYSSVVQCNATDNGIAGIRALNSTVAHSVVTRNHLHGINAPNSVVSYSVSNVSPTGISGAGILVWNNKVN